jgi:hypothetical protein
VFERKILHKLLEWKDSPYRKPLVLRGARQVGKTTLIDQFSSSYDQYLYLNLETKEDKSAFHGKKSIGEIIDALFFIKDKSKNMGTTLIFLDEIQEMPDAIASLRYFHEKFPHYHVIAAGSLLEAVMKPKIQFPVGRVDYLMLHPFSFEEFLMACGENMILDQYLSVPVAPYAHEKLLRIFHTYTLIGGMPEAVNRYVETRDLVTLKPVYEALLLSYMEDVEKYARNLTQVQVIQHAIPACFREAGSRIKFHGFGSSVYGSREMGEALRTLQKARLINLVYPTVQTKLPFMPDVKKSPRLQVVDTGLFNFYAGIQKDVFNSGDLTDVFSGRVIEHIVGQELTANNHELLQNVLFWVREKEGTSAELDFLMVRDGKAFPVEVKSGKSGKLRSLHQFVDSSGAALAIRLYGGTFSIDELSTLKGTPFTLLNIPYYQAGNLANYIDRYSTKAL